MPPHQSSPATSNECSGGERVDYGCSSGGVDEKNVRRELAKEVGSTDASSWCTSARSPKAGERVQVFGGAPLCGVVWCGRRKRTAEIASCGEQHLP